MSVFRKYWTRPFLVAIVVLVGCVLASRSFDRWRQDRLIARERAVLGFYLRSHVESIESALDRHSGRLATIAAMVDVQPTPVALSKAFPLVAAQIQSTSKDIKALQLNLEGRVAATIPASDSVFFKGYNLLQDPRQEIRTGVERALRSPDIVITGPVLLRQGGTGLILRHRIAHWRPGFPDMASMVIDLDAMLKEVLMVAPLPRGSKTVIVDRENRPIRGDSSELENPIRLPVRTGDGEWTVLATPVIGWEQAVSYDLQTSRSLSVLLSVFLTLVTFALVWRHERLKYALSEGTRELARANEDLKREEAERVVLEEQLLHSQKMKAVGTLAGGIAHDFNNLLTAISGFASLSEQHALRLSNALAGSAESEEVDNLRSNLQEINRATSRAIALITQLMTFSRRQPLAPVTMDLNVVLRNTESMLRSMVGERISFVISYESNSLPVLADQNLVAQVVTNLVVNARDAMPTGGRLEISTARSAVNSKVSRERSWLPEGNWAILTVEDDGRGMEPEVEGRMWEPFFTTGQLGNGAGLGLSVVYNVVTEAGGHVHCESGLGKGTTVTIALPCLTDSKQSLPAPDVDTVKRPVRESGKIILAVEDEAGIRRLVSEILRRSGYDVRLASDGAEALEQLKRGLSPDLVLTDVIMPRMGGPELVRAMEQEGFSPPVLYMTGYQGDIDSLNGAGRLHIDKPFTPDTLITRVREALMQKAA